MQVVTFVEELDGSTAPGSASVEGAVEVERPPVATTRDVIDGTAGKVVAPSSTAHTTVFRRRTSTRSDAGRSPCPHETEKVDGGVLLEPELSTDRLDGLGDAIAHH